jgi:maltose alpha-D-glucosyltransferase/alpha-amylase
MQWNGGINAGFSGAPPDRLYNPVIEGEHYGHKQLNVASQQADPGSLWHTLHRMITIRKDQPVFTGSNIEVLPVEDRAIFAPVRIHQHEALFALHNFSAQSKLLELNLSRWQGWHAQELLSARSFPDVNSGSYPVPLEPYGYVWLKLSR